MVNFCGHCGNPCSFKCSRCRQEHYCDKECFKKAWKKHKKICVPSAPDGAGSSEKWDADDQSREAIQMMERENIGGLAGSSMNNVIGGFLGLHEASATMSRWDQQQSFMKVDRIPEIKAVVEGNFKLYRAKNDEEVTPLADAHTLLADGTICYTVYGRRGNSKKSGDFMFLHPGSLTIEMNSWCTGLQAEEGGISPFKLLDGNVMYLAGEKELFWPMVVNFRNTGTCFPPNIEGVSVENTYMMREAERIYEQMHNKKVGKGEKVRISSRSKAFTQIGHFPNHPMLQHETIPSRQDALPEWWLQLAKFWDGAFERCGIPGNMKSNTTFRPPCMFYNTPAGCMKSHMGETCIAWHDTNYQADIDAIIKARCINPSALKIYKVLKDKEREKMEKVLCERITRKLQKDVDSGALKLG